MTNFKYRPHHTPEYKQARNEIILRMRNEGYSLQKIGDKFNVSREYIRQILQKEFDITGCIKFVAGQEASHDEYTALEIAKMFDTPVSTVNVWLMNNCIPQPTRTLDKSKNRGLDKKFWKKENIDKWIQIRLKYLKIYLEKSIKNRMSNPAPYRFGHHRVQELYKILQMAKDGDIKSLTLYKNGIPDEVMQEFNNLTKPIQYTPTDYSKYIKMKTTEDYKKMGLFDACKTEKIINITNTTMKRYKKAGILKENEHYIVGKHYHHRTMYYPEKTKQAIIDAGYDQKLAAAQKRGGLKEMFCRAKKLPPFDLIKELLNYNIITGVFTWKVKKSNKKAGSIAGRTNAKGYRYITINKRSYAAHRLAWLLVTKKDPHPYEVDHKDGNTGNNAFHNLRQATPQQNSSNRKIGSNNTSGHKSITFNVHQPINPYTVCISQKNKSHSLGSFPTLEKAIEARNIKGRQLYGEFYRP